MKGIWKMLTGQGEAEYRAQHQAFRDAIPDDFPFVVGSGDQALVRYGPGGLDIRPATCEDLASLPSHPAHSGKFANMSDGMNYRRATWCNGPMPKSENAKLVQVQNTYDEYASYLADCAAKNNEPDFRTWMDQHGIPLNGGA